MAGKGDRPRPGVYSQEYKQNHERIFGKKSNEGTLYGGVDKDAQKNKNV